MKRRALFALLALVPLTACATRERHEEIRNIGGRDFICTWVKNKISGNPSAYTCYPIEGQS